MTTPAFRDELTATASAALAPALPRKGWLKLAPVNQRRLDNFRANRRGWWSMWLFMTLFVLSLFANFLANDRPIVVSYKGELLFPVFVDYPEEKFGGFLATTDYRDPVIADEIGKNGWAVWPPVHFSYNTRCADLEWNWLGTDADARDVVARLVYGFRVSILFGLILAGISSVVGVLAGAVQGYFGGWTDLLMQRFIEIWSSLPRLYLLIIVSSIITPSFFVLLFILLLFSWVSLVHVVRAEFLRARNFEYVNAARALGLSNAKIMFRHLLPNAMVATLTFLPFVVNASITTLTSLDFLGLGLPPGSASLGELLLQGKSNLEAPWLALTGFCTIALMLSLLVFVGEAVRDAFDPRKTFS